MLVVLHHLTSKHYAPLVSNEAGSMGQLWLSLAAAVEPVRMPLFFMLSGFFATAALRRPWREVLGPRVISVYYLYVLWLCIHAVIFSVERSLPMNRTKNPQELAADLVFASTGLWYLYALAVYFLVLKLFGPARPWLPVGFAAVLAVTGSILPIDEVNRVSVLQSFLYFTVGASFPGVVRGIADSRRRHTVPLLLVGYLSLGAALLWLGVGRGPTVFALSVIGVPLAIRCAVGLSTFPRLASASAWVGRHTLPVYVLHMPVLAVLHHLLKSLPVHSSLATTPPLVVAVYPLLATIVITVTCLLLHKLLTEHRLGWLFLCPAGIWQRSQTANDPKFASPPERHLQARPG